MNSPNRRQSERGITLIEMLVVVTIIALFAALVAPRMLGQAISPNPLSPRLHR